MLVGWWCWETPAGRVQEALGSTALAFRGAMGLGASSGEPGAELWSWWSLKLREAMRFGKKW